MEEHKENSFVFDESSLNGDVCPNVLRMAHIKESLACHEEAQRLQRMCRDLKVCLAFQLSSFGGGFVCTDTAREIDNVIFLIFRIKSPCRKAYTKPI